MDFGPYAPDDAVDFEHALRASGLRFARNFGADPSRLFFSVADDDAAAVRATLKRFGVPLDSDHSVEEEWICPTCNLSQSTRGSCPNDGAQLLTAEGLAKALEKGSGRHTGELIVFLVALAVAGAVVFAFAR